MLTERRVVHQGPVTMLPVSMNTSLDDPDCIQRPSCAWAGRHGYHNDQRPSPPDPFDDIDEDEISDDEDCHMLHREYISRQLDAKREEEETSRLLDFAERTNKDLDTLFGAKNKSAGNIYEDRWKRGKSGRELYYADLLRIAQGEDTEEKTYSGKMDKKLGLGPLKDLFDVNRNSSMKTRVRSKARVQMLPMRNRQLPASFWKEPNVKWRAGVFGARGEGVDLQSDFSDLLDSLQMPTGFHGPESGDRDIVAHS